MSIGLPSSPVVAPTGIAADELRATEDRFGEFFGDVFDRLQGLSLELFARHKCLEAGAEQKSESTRTPAGLREEFYRSIEQLEHLHGQFQADRQEAQQAWAETRAGWQQFLDDAGLREIGEGFRRMTSELCGIKAELQEMRSLLETWRKV